MKITYIGHATCLIEINGKKILTDPIWAERIFFIKRLQEPGLPLADVLPVDLVLLSHAHFDHFDSGTLKHIDKETPVVCSKNLNKLLRLRGFKNINDLDWWDELEIFDFKITAVPARHFGGRWQFWDKYLAYGGFVIKTRQESLFFAGDSAYFEVFATMGQKFKIDVCLLPIGAYQGPGLVNFRKVHMDPKQAIQAFQDLQAKHLIPIHFGTFKLSAEPVAEPEQWLRKIIQQNGLEDQVNILKPGEFFVNK